jgi:hypothetical protein
MAGIGLTSGAGMGSSSSSGSGGVSKTLVGDGNGSSKLTQVPSSLVQNILGGSSASGAVPGTLGVYSGNQGKPAVSQPVSASLPAWGAPTTLAAASPTVNTAEANPVSNEIISTLKSRAAGDMGLPGELDAATREIRDRASAGIEGDTIAQIRSGRLGDSSGQRDADARGDLQREQINKITTDLTLGRERDRDALNLSTANLALGQSGQQLSATGQAQQAQLSQQAEARAQASDNWQRQAAADAAVRDAQQTSWNTLLNLLS